MSFNSMIFALFMGIVFLVYWMVSDKYRWIVALVASVLFYLGFGVNFFVLLSTVTVFSFLSSLAIDRNRNGNIHKIIFTIIIMAIICILVYYKYAAFLMQTMSELLKITVLQLHPFVQKLALPMGISFYSFKALSYVIDVYRGRKPETNLARYASYMFFFLKLHLVR